MKGREAILQTECVRWFRYQFPKLALLLFAVPNGGSRNALEAVNLKAQGVTAGVADLILLVPNKTHASLCIEMKTGSAGRQSERQKAFQTAAENAGNRYVLCRTFDEFRETVTSYLHDR